jgi:hypothetical protein
MNQNLDYLFTEDKSIKDCLKFFQSRKVAHNLISDLREFDEGTGKRLFCLNDLIAIIICHDLKEKGGLGVKHFPEFLNFLKYKNGDKNNLPIVKCLLNPETVISGRFNDDEIEWSMDDSTYLSQAVIIIPLSVYINKVFAKLNHDSIKNEEFFIGYANHLTELDRASKFAKNHDCEINLKYRDGRLCETKVNGSEKVMEAAVKFFKTSSKIKEIVIPVNKN